LTHFRPFLPTKDAIAQIADAAGEASGEWLAAGMRHEWTNCYPINWSH